MADGFDKPNGIAFAPDERVLYVTDSGANHERFFGRPSAYQLWEDLQDLFRWIKDDFDPTLAEVRER